MANPAQWEKEARNKAGNKGIQANKQAKANQIGSEQKHTQTPKWEKKKGNQNSKAPKTSISKWWLAKLDQ